MASLYFAEQKAQKRISEDSSNPPRSNYGASSVVGGMSYVGNDGIDNNMTPIPPPLENKQDEITGDVIIDAEVEPVSVSGGRTVASDITENTGRFPGNNTIANETVATSTGVDPTIKEGVEEQPTSDGKKDKSNDEGGNRCLMIILCVICCLLLAGGAGAGVGIALSGGSDDEASPITEAPVAVVTDPPKPPPIETKPTLAPVAPNTPRPNPIPTNPPQEASSPTATPDFELLNDNCEDATALSTIGVTFGSTGSATIDLGAIGTGCGINEADAVAGVWYRVVGTGAELTASTCGATTGFDTKLAVFTGPCDSLRCVAFNDDTLGQSCDVQSTADWISDEGTTYFILVHGYENERGDFELAIRAKEVTNDFCDGAITISTDGTFMTGTTTPATLDFAGLCGDADITAPGVWFTFAGTGETLAVNSCTGSAFDTKLSVYQGSCGNLVCVGGNDDFPGCSGFTSRVIVASESGISYYVLIHGYQGDTGIFGLQVTPLGNVYPETCSDAVPLLPGDNVFGDNILARYDYSTSYQCDVTFNGPTVWYSVVGTGGILKASTSSANTDFDTQLIVWEGNSCASIFCVGGNDDSEQASDACSRCSSYEWQSELFRDYYIAVFGFDNATGTFELFVDDLGGSASFGSCEEAAGVPLGTPEQILATDPASIDQGYLSCGSSTGSVQSGPGFWARMTGNGEFVSVSVCNNPSVPSVRVFSGGCQSLSCVDASGSDCEKSWQSTNGETYYIYVDASSAEYYEFFASSPIRNDFCSGAIPLVVNSPDVVYGSTAGANPDTEVNGGTCGETITSPGVWHSVIGEGSAMAVTLCDGSDFDTKVSVFSGDCDNLECVGGVDDSDCAVDNLLSIYEWASVPGVTYYILVHGYGDESGQYGIRVVSA